MKLFFYLKKLLFFSSIVTTSLILILIINYYVDGGDEFYQAMHFENRLASNLLKKNNALICVNYNERSLKRRLLESLPVRPDVLVLGSSRTMAIRQDLFKDSRFFNASVPASNLEDDIALFYIYQKRGWTPKIVVIGLDPWILDTNPQMFIWGNTFSLEYIKAKKLILGTNHVKSRFFEKLNGFLVRYSQLLSPYYLRSSLLKLRSPSDMFINPKINDYNNFPACYIYLPDGTRLTSKLEELTSVAQADFVSSVDIQRSSIPLQTSSDAIYLFEHFINYLINQHVKVIFYLPPYEPIAYAQLVRDSNYKLVSVNENYFFTIAARYHLKVIGSYNPTKINLTADSFIDDVHLKKAGIDKVFGSNKI